VGTWVIYEEKHYRNFYIGKVKEITPKTVLVEHLYPGNTNYNTTTRQIFNQVIVIEESKVPEKYKKILTNTKTI
jgi:hypothetical protein